MEENLPVWAYYKKGFVDPLYAPYQSKKVHLAEGSNKSMGKCRIDLRTPYKSLSLNSNNRNLIRDGWGMRFQKQFSYDPCPRGFMPDPDNLGYCIQKELEYEPIFYTEKAYLPKYVFHSKETKYEGTPWRSNYGWEIRNIPYERAGIPEMLIHLD